MGNFSWLPKNDPKQVVRISRVMLAFAYSILYLISLSLFYWQGMLSKGLLIHAVVTVAVLIIGFYLVFRFNLNKKSNDASLTSQQLFASIVYMLYVIYYAPQTRVVFVVFLLISLMFGMLRLRTRELLMLSGLALMGYVGLAVLRYLEDNDAAVLRMDLLLWFVLAITLPSFVFMGARVRKLRTELRETSFQLEGTEIMAHTDELTGIFNRRYITAAMHNEKNRCDLTGGTFCICIMDIDHFKLVNDTIGHLAGDEVLRNFAQQIQKELRDSDTFGRYGGEEFLQILNNTTLEGGLIHAERTRNLVEKIRYPQFGETFGITVSIGVAQYEIGEPVLHTFARADEALYQAKADGRNKVTWGKFNPALKTTRAITQQASASQKN